jgi:hypothetical protein
VNEDAVSRILLAMRDGVPPDLDRQELLSDLEGTASLYRTGIDWRVAPAKRRQQIGRIIEAAEHLKSLIGSHYPLSLHRKALDRLIDDAKADDPPRLLRELGVHESSAFERLIRMLKSTFEKHFPGAALYTQDYVLEEIRGPFILFAEAVLEEMGVGPYSRKTIAKAVWKAGKPLTP